MGLDIGFKVKRGIQPFEEIDVKDVENKCQKFLKGKFPKGGFAVEVSMRKLSQYVVELMFDVRMFGYGQEFRENYPRGDMYVELLRFIEKELFNTDGLELKMYWNG